MIASIDHEPKREQARDREPERVEASVPADHLPDGDELDRRREGRIAVGEGEGFTTRLSTSRGREISPDGDLMGERLLPIHISSSGGAVAAMMSRDSGGLVILP